MSTLLNELPARIAMFATVFRLCLPPTFLLLSKRMWVYHHATIVLYLSALPDGHSYLKLAHSRISQYMSKPNLGMYKAVRHALLYCANTANYCLHQPHDENAAWTFFSDSDHAGNAEPDNKRRSQLAFTAMYGKAPIAWGSKATHVRFDEASRGSEPASGKPYLFGAPRCHDKCTNLHPNVSSAATGAVHVPT